MSLEDEKIRALVHTADNLKNVNRNLKRSLSPMSKAGFRKYEMGVIDKRVLYIVEQLEELQKDILMKLYK